MRALSLQTPRPRQLDQLEILSASRLRKRPFSSVVLLKPASSSEATALAFLPMQEEMSWMAPRRSKQSGQNLLLLPKEHQPAWTVRGIDQDRRPGITLH